jgi:hypothetical protein
LTGRVAEVSILQQLVESQRVLALVNSFEVAVLFQGGLHILVALTIVDGVNILELRFNEVLQVTPFAILGPVLDLLFLFNTSVGLDH